MEHSRKRNRDLRGDSGDAKSLGYGLRRRNSGKEEEGAPGNGRHQARFHHIADESRKMRNSPTKRMECMSAEPSIKSKGRKFAGAININESKKKRVTVADQNELQYDDFRVPKTSPPQNSMAFECSEGLRVERFVLGDIVWARSDSRVDIPAWPAQVIDPVQDAPQFVLSIRVPQRLCVRFFGVKRSWEYQYAWVKEEMMFPFWESFETLSYEGQKLLERYSKHLKGEFLKAIKEAYVSDFSSGYNKENKPDEDRHQGEETICSSCSQKFPASKLLESVNVKQLGNSSKKDVLICLRCYNLYESNQYCGICKKVWNPTLKRNWVECQECKIWVHADCDNISSEKLQDLIEYSCPHCTLKQPDLSKAPKEENNRIFTVPDCITVVSDGKEEENSRPFTLPERMTVVCDGKEEENNTPNFSVPGRIAVVCDGKQKKNNKSFTVPEHITVVCDGNEEKNNNLLVAHECIAVVCDDKEEKNNMPFVVPEGITVICNDREGHYVPKSHLVLCECSECGKGRLMSLSRWEKHVGCKSKKWKQSIRVRDSSQHLIGWLNKAHEDGACGLGFFIGEGKMGKMAQSSREES